MTANTATTLTAATGLDGPYNIAVNSAADLFVLNYSSGVLSEISTSSSTSTSNASPPPPPPPLTLNASLSRVAGQSTEGTAAAEFLNQLAPGSANCADNGAAVLATSADPYDALAAAPLEGALGTGLIVTPPSASGAIDPATLDALQVGGVSELYVVGGPDAVTPAELTTLRATPAYECGGTTKTGKDLQVIEVATTGASALDTAALIDAYLSTSAPASNAGSTLPSLGAAYGSSLLDQAGGNSSPSGPETVSGTAIVVSANDWQDAAAISGLAYRYHLPVVLTSGTSLSPQAATELQALGVDQVIAVGGPSALSQGVVTAVETLKVNASPIAVLRIAGTTATETSADIALLAGTLLGWPNKTLLVAQGTPSGWSDALSAAAQSGGGEDALLLTAGPGAALPSSLTSALISAGSTASGFGAGQSTGIEVLGGPLAVTDAQASALQAALNGQ